MNAPTASSSLLAEPIPVAVLEGDRCRPGKAWFVHGMIEDDKCWRELAALLNQEVSLMPHFPWSAQQGSTWGSEAEAHAWIAGFASKQDEPAEVAVAHSFGCNALLEYLLLNPWQQPKALILISPFYRPSREHINWETLLDLANGLEPLIGESIAIHDARGRYTGWLRDEMVSRLRDRLGVYGWAEFLKLFLRAPDLPLQRLHCPTLVISGQNDRYCRPQTNAELAAALPSGRHVSIDGAGHFPQITHATEASRHIRAFCADVVGAPTRIDSAERAASRLS